MATMRKGKPLLHRSKQSKILRVSENIIGVTRFTFDLIITIYG